jgi:hypothetical protein
MSKQRELRGPSAAKEQEERNGREKAQKAQKRKKDLTANESE